MVGRLPDPYRGIVTRGPRDLIEFSPFTDPPTLAHSPYPRSLFGYLGFPSVLGFWIFFPLVLSLRTPPYHKWENGNSEKEKK